MTPLPLQDMYVDFNKAQETAGHIKGIQQWITNEFMHSGAPPSCCHVPEQLHGIVATPNYGSRCCHRPVSYKQSVLAKPFDVLPCFCMALPQASATTAAASWSSCWAWSEAPRSPSSEALAHQAFIHRAGQPQQRRCPWHLTATRACCRRRLAVGPATSERFGMQGHSGMREVRIHEAVRPPHTTTLQSPAGYFGHHAD